jgi:hypothetical protein
MNLTLTNSNFLDTGIFGTLKDENNNFVAVTLQHAYTQGNDVYAPKLYPGVFTCVRGDHQLASMKFPFETFEITGVKGHTNILFHVGNYNKDSEGCVLLGSQFDHDSKPTMIIRSEATFKKFMDLQTNVNNFILTVI